MNKANSSTAELDNSLNRIVMEVCAIARNRNPEKVSWKTLRQAILEAATYLRLKTNQTAPPVKLHEILYLQRINRPIYFPGSSSTEAVLVPVARGFKIKVPRGRAPQRNRFSIAHEIAHTFFFDLLKSPPTRILALGPSGFLSPKEEEICCAFARELLMPSELVVAEQKRYHAMNSLDFLFLLARCFWVSQELAAIRLLWDLSEFKTTVGLFKDTDKEDFYSKISPPRRYFGKHVRSLRQYEKKMLEFVTEALRNGPPFDELEELANQNKDIIELQWKVKKNQRWQNVVALLNFHRDK